MNRSNMLFTMNILLGVLGSFASSVSSLAQDQIDNQFGSTVNSADATLVATPLGVATGGKYNLNSEACKSAKQRLANEGITLRFEYFLSRWSKDRYSTYAQERIETVCTFLSTDPSVSLFQYLPIKDIHLGDETNLIVAAEIKGDPFTLHSLKMNLDIRITDLPPSEVKTTIPIDKQTVASVFGVMSRVLEIAKASQNISFHLREDFLAQLVNLDDGKKDKLYLKMGEILTTAKAANERATFGHQKTLVVFSNQNSTSWFLANEVDFCIEADGSMKSFEDELKYIQNLN